MTCARRLAMLIAGGIENEYNQCEPMFEQVNSSSSSSSLSRSPQPADLLLPHNVDVRPVPPNPSRHSTLMLLQPTTCSSKRPAVPRETRPPVRDLIAAGRVQLPQPANSMDSTSMPSSVWRSSLCRAPPPKGGPLGRRRPVCEPLHLARPRLCSDLQCDAGFFIPSSVKCTSQTGR